ncbi:vacuolar protein sorting-associated protein 26-domain-containing protein [Phycomyces nitens]|nr:vacuolar protein sorting-associated protein 26-domain-containing protein [Phycomyces nitens]
MLAAIFGSPVSIEIQITDIKGRKRSQLKPQEDLPIFFAQEPVRGRVLIGLPKDQFLDHQGIRVECIGRISTTRTKDYDFLYLSQELIGPKKQMKSIGFEFGFMNVNKPFESYYGTQIKLRYFVRVMVKTHLSDLSHESDILVCSHIQHRHPTKPLKMEIGLDNCLHIEFKCNKTSYHLEDVVVGRIIFRMVRIKIKLMELWVVRRESIGSSPLFNESEALIKYEIMDGEPFRGKDSRVGWQSNNYNLGDSIPIRLFLGDLHLTPTLKDVNKKFSVIYFLSLVLYDESSRRYYKQQEIGLYRQG